MDLRRHTLALCLGFTLALLASSGLDAGEPRRGGTLRIGYVQDITGLDPHTSGGFPAAYIQQNLFQSLVTLNEALEIVPELADSWEVHDGGKTYVFHLRHGVQFHDATPFDAQAVKWNFERLLNPEEAVLFRGFFASVDTVEVVDAQTVRITQRYPSHMLLPALASYGLTGFLMVSPTSYQRWGRQELPLHPAGTGPFMFTKWEPNRLILLERNPRYWKPGLPYLDRLEFTIIKEGVTRTTALRRGEVDFANRVPVEQVGLVEHNNVVLDLSGTKMVDHSVMERLHEMELDFEQAGLQLEILGLDSHRQFSAHPHAARKRSFSRIKRVTIVADGDMEAELTERCMALGASGYTSIPCHGAGRRTAEAGVSRNSQVRIEVVAPPEVAEQILEYIHRDVSLDHAVTACIETVEVLRREQF